MKKKMKKLFLYLVAGFVVLFGFRMLYGYWGASDGQVSTYVRGTESEGAEYSKKNYASAQLKIEKSAGNQSYSVDQKYEKIASMVSRSQSFDEEEKQVRELTSKYNALIQYEQISGMKGN